MVATPPVARQWEDGEDVANLPTAADLNADWTNSLKFLFGDSRPLFLGRNTVATALSAAWVSVPINSEVLKRNVTHATNDTKVYVPYAGRYSGVFIAGITAPQANGRIYTSINVNNAATGVTNGAHAPVAVASTYAMSFTVDLAANDYIEARIWEGTAATGVTTQVTGVSLQSLLGLWYVGGA